ncbi:MAG: phenylacetate--CoA ligase family protein, partial [Thermodesulfobacteria bacterium]|nr:phenylacetate--CoA ligase family protein [Thermodesulfobacteriota bacterium]
MYQPRLETLPREELEKLQLKRLRATIAHIKANNARYAAHLGEVEPEDIRHLSDVKNLPFITKDDLREAYPLGLACAPKEDFVRFHMSSGTTGT